jgi:hypothetical protein
MKRENYIAVAIHMNKKMTGMYVLQLYNFFFIFSDINDLKEAALQSRNM